MRFSQYVPTNFLSTNQLIYENKECPLIQRAGFINFIQSEQKRRKKRENEKNKVRENSRSKR